MTNSDITRRVVTDYVRALQRGDIDALRASFAPDSTWTVCGSTPVSGTWTGPDGILNGFLARVLAQLDPAVPPAVEVHRVLADGEHALAEWTTRARTRDGRTYRNDYAVVFHVVDGRIAEVTEYLDTALMTEVLFTPVRGATPTGP